MQHDVYDVTIIGGGPAGLFSAFYSGLRSMKTKLIEFQSELGGKVHIYPEKMLWDVGGNPPILAQDFIHNLVEQGLTFAPTVCLNTKVELIERGENLFVINTEDGTKHYSKSVILAVGGGIISPQKLSLEGAEKFEVTNLHYTVQRVERFKDRHLLISGGGNAAVDWAVELLQVAASVTVIYRKDQLPAHEAQVEAFVQNGGKLLLNTSIQSLISNDAKTAIQEVIISTNGIEQTISVDDVLINHGYNRDKSLSFSEDVQPELVEDYYFKGTSKSLTTVDGIFAAGDIIDYEGKIHLIIGAFQDAVNAVNSAKKYIEPEAYDRGMVSSHNDIFKSRNAAILKEKLNI